jgi:hypothetical protein
MLKLTIVSPLCKCLLSTSSSRTIKHIPLWKVFLFFITPNRKLQPCYLM